MGSGRFLFLMLWGLLPLTAYQDRAAEIALEKAPPLLKRLQIKDDPITYGLYSSAYPLMSSSHYGPQGVEAFITSNQAIVAVKQANQATRYFIARYKSEGLNLIMTSVTAYTNIPWNRWGEKLFSLEPSHLSARHHPSAPEIKFKVGHASFSATLESGAADMKLNKMGGWSVLGLDLKINANGYISGVIEGCTAQGSLAEVVTDNVVEGNMTLSSCATEGQYQIVMDANLRELYIYNTERARHELVLPKRGST